MNNHALIDFVDVDTDILSGVPVIKGTRVSASLILAELAEGGTIAEIADDLEIDEVAIQSFINGLSALFNKPWIEPPVPCVIESLDGKEAVCLVEIHGFSLPTKLPLAVLEKHNLTAVGDRFSWRIRSAGTVQEDDIEPLVPTLTEKEDRELERLRLGRELAMLSKEYKELHRI